MILDLGLPDMSPRQVIESVLAAAGRAKVIVFTSLFNPVTLQLVGRSRLHGYLDKGNDLVPRFREAIATVLSGRIYRPDWFEAKYQETRVMADTFVNVLTEREQEVLPLLGQALSDEEVAARLDVAPLTARNYRAKIMQKLGLHSTPEVMRYALEKGFVLPQTFSPRHEQGEAATPQSAGASSRLGRNHPSHSA